MVVDAPEVLHRLEAVDDLDAALVCLAGVPALLLRPLAVVPEAVPILGTREDRPAPGVLSIEGKPTSIRVLVFMCCLEPRD